MASFSRKTGIIGALIIAGVLIVGSVVLSGTGLSFLNPQIANADSTQALLQQLASREHDGLPDWEAELYGLDPNNPHSFSPTITNAQAIQEGLVKPKFLTELATSTDATSTDDSDVPGIAASPNSLTGQFSQLLMTQYLNQSESAAENDSVPSDQDVIDLAQSEMQTFAQSNEHQNAYVFGQIQPGGTGAAAMDSYAATAEGIFAANKPDTTESEVDYFSDAIEKNDTAALTKVSAIGTYYTQLAPALMQIKVPVEAENAHLEIANACYRLGADITDLSMMNSDPLRAYLGLAQYQLDSASLAKGFSDLGAVFSQEQINIPEGTPGYYLYATALQAQTAETSQKSNSDNSQN